jgi:8-oxo-dGTP diphosphatase
MDLQRSHPITHPVLTLRSPYVQEKFVDMSETEPRVGSGAAIIVGERILLLRRSTAPESGCWSLPSGKVGLYETTARATERETMEEIGINIEARDLLCLVEHLDQHLALHWVGPVYLITSFTGTPIVAEPNKHCELAWWPVDRPPTQLTHSASVALRSWRDRRAATTAPATGAIAGV